jgi:hypothetical protein
VEIMADDKVRQAILAIKSGNRQMGQQLLVEVLKEDSKNETAWLWMASLVSGDKRRLCLENVLRINPNHTVAQAQMAKLSAPPAQPMERVVQPTPSVQPAAPPSVMPASVSSTPMPARDVYNDQVWWMPGKHLSTIISLSGDTLLAFDILPHLAQQVVHEIKSGVPQKQLNSERNKYHLQNVCYVPLTRVKTVSLFGELMKVIIVNDTGGEKSFNITCDKTNSETVLDALQMRLGARFKKISRPISRAQVWLSALVLLLMTLCGTGFFYWFVQGLAREDQITGSARARGIAALLLLIGPNGFLCIGGVLLVIILFALISSLAKPPEETVLVSTPG